MWVDFVRAIFLESNFVIRKGGRISFGPFSFGRRLSMAAVLFPPGWVPVVGCVSCSKAGFFLDLSVDFYFDQFALSEFALLWFGFRCLWFGFVGPSSASALWATTSPQCSADVSPSSSRPGTISRTSGSATFTGGGRSASSLARASGHAVQLRQRALQSASACGRA